MKHVLALAIVGIFFWVGVLTYSDFQKRRPAFASGVSGTSAPTVQTDPSYPTIGDDVRLEEPVVPAILVCTTEDALASWNKAAHAGDPLGQNALIDSGQVLACPQGTRAKMIDLGGWFGNGAKVRVLTGKHAGRAVWVTMSQMKRISLEK